MSDNLNLGVPTYSEVKLVQDDSGHLYFVPIAEYHDFLCELFDMSDDYSAFNSKYHKYMKNPAEVKLYMREN